MSMERKIFGAPVVPLEQGADADQGDFGGGFDLAALLPTVDGRQAAAERRGGRQRWGRRVDVRDGNDVSRTAGDGGPVAPPPAHADLDETDGSRLAGQSGSPWPKGNSGSA